VVSTRHTPVIYDDGGWRKRCQSYQKKTRLVLTGCGGASNTGLLVWWGWDALLAFQLLRSALPRDSFFLLALLALVVVEAPSCSLVVALGGYRTQKMCRSVSCQGGIPIVGVTAP
jgi:hypothetical protein